MSPAVVAAYLACALIWGTTWYAIRASIADYPTFLAVALRFAIAAVLLLPLAIRMRPWPSARVWMYLVLAGVLDAAAYLLVYLGEERIAGSLAAVLFGTYPLLLAIALSITRSERLTRRHLLGCVLSFAGVLVLLVDRLDVSPRQAAGVCLMLCSVIATTGYSMIMKRHERAVHGIVATAIFVTVTAVVLAIVALAAGDPLPWPPPATATIAILHLGVLGTVVAFLLYFWLLRRTGLLISSTLVFVYPLVAIAMDAFFERELPLDRRTYLGAALTLTGLAFTLRRTPSPGLSPRAPFRAPHGTLLTVPREPIDGTGITGGADRPLVSTKLQRGVSPHSPAAGTGSEGRPSAVASGHDSC